MRPTAVLLFAAAATGIATVSLLACAVLTGLARLGVMVPTFALTRAAWHGVPMIPAFFGTVISLERAVAMQRVAPYVAPTVTVVAGAAPIAGSPAPVVQALLVMAACMLVAATLRQAGGLASAGALVLFVLTLRIGACRNLATNCFRHHLEPVA